MTSNSLREVSSHATLGLALIAIAVAITVQAANARIAAKSAQPSGQSAITS